jgi:hypothetical protein
MKLEQPTIERSRRRKEAQAIKRLVDEISMADDRRRKDEKFSILVAAGFTLLLITMLILFAAGQAHATEAYSDEEIVNAIYKAEGGEKAQYPYGIRSIPCSGKESCGKICRNTVRNNRKRFAKNPGTHTSFISFLGSRYCPTRGNLSKAEKKLNGNWEKNVLYFLAKGRK